MEIAMKILAGLKRCLIGAGIWVASSIAFGSDVVTVYFVPFEVETYVPITPSTIRASAWEKWTIRAESRISQLLDLLDHGDKAQFDEKRVRGEVIVKNHTYFVDANGVVVRNKLAVRIDKAQLVKFRESLRADEKQTLNSTPSP